METFIVQVNSEDAGRLRQISAQNGWHVESRSALLQEFIKTAPKDVPLSDDDIMEEVRSVRYGS